MASGTIVASWQDGANAYMSVRVAEPRGGGSEDVEYVGALPLADLAGLTAAQKKTALTAAARAVRTALLGAGRSGTCPT
jgi:hypothetical protein